MSLPYFTATLLVDAQQVLLGLCGTLVAMSLATGEVMWKQPIAQVSPHDKLAVALAVVGQAVQADAR